MFPNNGVKLSVTSTGSYSFVSDEAVASVNNNDVSRSARTERFVYHTHDENEINPGLTLVGMCENRNCIVDQFRVSKGFGSFDIKVDFCNMHCPECDREKVGLSEIVFLECRYLLEGQKKGEIDNILWEEKEIRRGADFLSKDVSKDDWSYLRVTTRRVNRCCALI